MVQPNLYFFNPTCEMSIANGTVSYQPNRFLQQFETDLGLLPAFLAKPSDWQLLNRIPSFEFIERLKAEGVELPELKRIDKVLAEETYTKNSFNEIRPWGWSPVFLYQTKSIIPFCSDVFQQDESRFLCRDDRYFYSRRFALDVLTEVVQNSSKVSLISEQQLPVQCFKVEEAEAAHQKNKQSVLKAPWSSSGRGLSMLRLPDFNSSIRNWVHGVIKSQGYIMCEPLLKKIVDFSFQFKIENGEIQYLGITFFQTDEKGQYNGHYLHVDDVLIDSEFMAFIRNNECQISEQLNVELSKKLKGKYTGYLGIDAMLVEIDRELRIQPCLEINLRYNMGILAIKLAEKVDKNFRQLKISTIEDMPKASKILQLTEITSKSVYAAYLQK